MSLRTRTTRGPSAKYEEPPGAGAEPPGAGPPEERQRRTLSLAVRVAIVAAVVLINLLIYANLGYFKAYAPPTVHKE